MSDSTDALSPAAVAAANPGGVPQAVDSPGGNIVNLLNPDDDRKRDIFMKGAEKLEQEKIGAEGALQAQEERQSAQYRARMEGMISREAASAEELKPWNAEQELASRKTDLWSQFGSPGFIIAMLGSAFTAMPMNSALNAGAAAMNAINQGDMKSYEKAFEAWKDTSKLVLDRIKLEHDQFADIDKLRQTDLAEWRMKAELLAQNYGDQRKLLLLKNGMDEDYFKARDAEATAAANMATTRKAIIDQNAIMMLAQNDPDYKSGDPQKMARAVFKAEKEYQEAQYAGRYSMFSPSAIKAKTEADIRADVDKEHPDWTDGQKDLEVKRRIKAAESAKPEKTQTLEDIKKELREKHKNDPAWTDAKIDMEAHRQYKESESVLSGNRREQLQAHVEQYDLAINDIIPSIEDVLNKYVGAAGIAGRVNRLGERVGNIFGSNQTARTQFMRDVENLQLMAPRLLLDQSTGRPLSVEAGHVADIIAGLNLGDTTANTLKAMDELKRRMGVLRQGVLDRMGGGDDGATVAPVANPKTATPKDWDAFPAVH